MGKLSRLDQFFLSADNTTLFLELLDRQLRKARDLRGHFSLLILGVAPEAAAETFPERVKWDWIGRISQAAIGIAIQENSYLDGLEFARQTNAILVEAGHSPAPYGIAVFPTDGTSLVSLLRCASLRARASAESPIQRIGANVKSRWDTVSALIGEEKDFSDSRVGEFLGAEARSNRTRRVELDTPTFDAIEKAVLSRLSAESNRWAATFIGSTNWQALATAPPATRGSSAWIVAAPGNAPEWLADGWRYRLDEDVGPYRVASVCATSFSYLIAGVLSGSRWRTFHSSDRALVESLWAMLTPERDAEAVVETDGTA